MMAQTAGSVWTRSLPRGKAMLARILSPASANGSPRDDVLLHAAIQTNDERYATANVIARWGTPPWRRRSSSFVSSDHGLCAGYSRRGARRTSPDSEHERDFGLQGMCVLVTGGTRGIGGAISMRLARAGATVVANFARNDAAAEALRSAAVGEGLHFRPCGPTHLAKARADSGADGARRQRIVSVVHCAATGVHKPFADLTLKHWDWTMALNVRAFFELVHNLLPLLRAGSAIVAVSSAGQSLRPRLRDDRQFEGRA
jgi:hypothetical protein